MMKSVKNFAILAHGAPLCIVYNDGSIAETTTTVQHCQVT